MKTIELARLTGTSVHTIRYYERLGLLRARRNRGNGYREFSQTHVLRLLFIRRARGMGLTLGEVRFVMGCAEGRSRCPEVLEIVRCVLPRVESELSELRAVHESVRKAIRTWRRLPNGLPSGRDVRRLVALVGAPSRKVPTGLTYRAGLG